MKNTLLLPITNVIVGILITIVTISTTSTTTNAWITTSTSTVSSLKTSYHHQHQQQQQQQILNSNSKKRWMVATTSSIPSTSQTTSSDTILDDEILGKDPNKKWHEHCTLPGDRDILVRAARGEITERTPVWLMRQAGRYMAAFREYSDRIPFRERSETPSTAIELSLQCHRAYGMDGIIMFSDILTPLPCLGIDFDVVKGTGPVISTIVRTEQDIDSLPLYEFDEKVSFVKEILQQLSVEAEQANTSLIGFVGAPFTLAAYTIEQKGSKHCLRTKTLFSEDEAGSNKMMTKFLDRLADLIGNYAIYQIEAGAQVIQFFESWAHQLSPTQFEVYAKPAALKAIAIVKEKYPDVPVIYFANGGSSYLEKQKDMIQTVSNPNPLLANMLAIDWQIDMSVARQILGHDVPISGNVDPSILRVGTKEQIEAAARQCIDAAGGPGNRHLLNVGHGVMQGTPELAIKYFVDEIKRYSAIKSD